MLQRRWRASVAALALLPTLLGNDLVVAVVRVVDGDTLRVQGPGGVVQAVRVAWIDAPEMAQPGGTAARAALAAQVTGAQVAVEVLATDRYRRPVVRVWADGHDVGLALVAAGQAWVFDRYPPPAGPLAAYQAAQAAARGAGRGLWARAALPPWQWRSGVHSESSNCRNTTTPAYRANVGQPWPSSQFIDTIFSARGAPAGRDTATVQRAR